MKNDTKRANQSSHPNQLGQGLVEYALVLVLIAVVVIVVLALVGPGVGNVFSKVAERLEPTTSPTPPAPPGCYGSLLLPIMLGLSGLTVALSMLLQKKFFPTLVMVPDNPPANQYEGD